MGANKVPRMLHDCHLVFDHPQSFALEHDFIRLVVQNQLVALCVFALGKFYRAGIIILGCLLIRKERVQLDAHGDATFRFTIVIISRFREKKNRNNLAQLLNSVWGLGLHIVAQEVPNGKYVDRGECEQRRTAHDLAIRNATGQGLHDRVVGPVLSVRGPAEQLDLAN